MTVATAAQRPAMPYDIIGGTDTVARFVDRFYDLMETEPGYAELRALHAPDLAPMRKSLTGFLAAWLGGPRDWFDARPGACVMSAHAKFAITRKTAGQWMDAMARAITDTDIETGMAARINEALERMALAMVRNG